MSTTTPVTAEQLLRMPDDGCRCELVAGELKKMPYGGFHHGVTAGKLHGRLAQHIEREGLGLCFIGGTGFLLARHPDTVRAPDIAFVQKAHIPDPLPEEAFWPGAPDLAVEVISFNDPIGEADGKARAWLDAGALMVWVVNPKRRSVTVYRSASDIRTLTEDDDLCGEDTVAGFRCRVGDIFAEV